MRAMVRYLGSLAGETGQWVGVEVPETLIPDEARKLSWNNGSRGEGEFFSPLTNVIQAV
jgi:dynactin complex subunit